MALKLFDHIIDQHEHLLIIRQDSGAEWSGPAVFRSVRMSALYFQEMVVKNDMKNYLNMSKTGCLETVAASFCVFKQHQGPKSKYGITLAKMKNTLIDYMRNTPIHERHDAPRDDQVRVAADLPAIKAWVDQQAIASSIKKSVTESVGVNSEKESNEVRHRVKRRM